MNTDPAGARSILVTGAGRGLGRAIALHLAAPGAQLFLHHNASEAGAQEVLREAAAKGARAVSLAADLADAAARDRMMAEVAQRTGALHVLVNGAGIYAERDLLETSAAEWQRVFDVTCGAVFHLTQLALPLLRPEALSRRCRRRAVTASRQPTGTQRR